MAHLTREFDPTTQHQRRAEKAFDAKHFDEVLAMAEKVCLGSPMPDIQRKPLTGEQELVSKIGLSGIRAALDFMHGGETQLPLPPGSDNGVDQLWMRPDLLIREPRFFVEGFDYNQATRVEAFGAQLMRESWKTLGPQAEEMAQTFKNATSDEEQYPVIDWLDKRLAMMAANNKNENFYTIYHPVRLSPKAIGIYPDVNIAPTCLSVSVIAAGFFREAGADVLYGGVVETGKQQLQRDLILQCETGIADQAHELFGIDLPAQLVGRLQNRAAEIAKWGANPEGVHASLLVRMQSGRWSQFDSNYQLSSNLPSIGGKDRDIDSIHNELTSLRAVAPGMEFFITSGMSSIVNFIQEVHRGNTDYNVSREQLREVLCRSAPDELLGRIQRMVVNPMFDYPTDSPYFAAIQRVVQRAFKSGDMDLLDMAYEDAALSWLVECEEPEVVIARCQEDPDYLEQKMVDAMLMGPLTAHLLGTHIFSTNDRSPESGSIHHVLEVGLPEASVGNAVLSEFTRHLGDDLSAHYWLAQWPSALATSEKTGLIDRSESETIALLNAMEVADTKRFTFGADYDKTMEFLEKYRERGTESEE